MKRPLAFAAVFGLAWAIGAAVVTALICAAKGRHEPVRHPLGLRCRRCEEPLADLGEAGMIDGGGYVGRRVQ